MRQAALWPEQEKFMKRLSEFLVETPDASVHISPLVYEAKEKEYILFYEAKKKYYLSTRTDKSKQFTEDDSLRIDKMSVKDSLFSQYLNKNVPHTLVFTVQGKCLILVGSGILNTRLAQLNTQRKNAFLAFFAGKDIGNRIVFSSVQDNIPYNGFSYYEIKYKGQFPDKLLKAYREMNKLNKEAPREKYDKDRKGLSML